MGGGGKSKNGAFSRGPMGIFEIRLPVTSCVINCAVRLLYLSNSQALLSTFPTVSGTCLSISTDSVPLQQVNEQGVWTCVGANIRKPPKVTCVQISSPPLGAAASHWFNAPKRCSSAFLRLISAPEPGLLISVTVYSQEQ